MKKKVNKPIGVFDSGLGGLTVVKALQKALPHEDIIYLGDSARLPYGTKSRKQIMTFSMSNAEFLKKKKVKAIVVACNSSSANAYYALQKKFSLPVVDVIRPAVIQAACLTQNHRIGVIGTSATVASKAYERELAKIDTSFTIVTQPCPLFVPLVEEGWLRDKISFQIAERYLLSLKKKKIDTLILGCTHYPLLKPLVRRVMGRSVAIVDSALVAAHDIAEQLKAKALCTSRSRKGTLKIFVTDLSQHFVKIGTRFLGQKLEHVKVVNVK